MSDNEGPVISDNGNGSMNNQDDSMESDNKPYRYGGNRGPRGGGRGNSRCYNCGQFGHMSYDCNRSGGGGGSMSFRSRNGQRCYNCQREGHISRDCNLPPGSKTCYNCGGEGHFSRDCGEPRKERPKNCFNCNQIGHIAAQCPSGRS